MQPRIRRHCTTGQPTASPAALRGTKAARKDEGKNKKMPSTEAGHKPCGAGEKSTEKARTRRNRNQAAGTRHSAGLPEFRGTSNNSTTTCRNSLALGSAGSPERCGTPRDRKQEDTKKTDRQALTERLRATLNQFVRGQRSGHSKQNSTITLIAKEIERIAPQKAT